MISDSIIQKLFSPWKITAISIAVSVVIYYVLSIISGEDILVFGIIMSTIIPAIVAYPVSAILIGYHKKIAAQKLELERLNELNNKLFSIIAHDIRSPISGVHGILELLKMDALSKEEFSKYLDELSLTTDALLQFLTDILQWSKQQIDNKKISRSIFETQSVWDQIIAIYKHNLDTKEIHLETRNLNGKIYADEGSYSFIVRNILHNAIKFTPKKGAISITIEETENHTHTIIEDSGIGINTDNLNKILYSKEWVSTPGTNNEKGTGFGLKASAKYIEMLNGSLKIESEANKGTRVTVTLPKEKLTNSL